MNVISSAQPIPTDCIEYGYLPTYIQDIRRAWRLAEQPYDKDPKGAVGVAPTPDYEKPAAIALQVRYAATLSVLNSLVSQIPAPLIAALVTQRIWTLEQAWTLMEHSLPGKQVEIFECLVNHLSDAEQHPALAAVLSVHDESARARMLILLAPVLPEALLIQVLKHLVELTSEHYRSLVLCSLSCYLPSHLISRALALTYEINNPIDRLTVLSCWVQRQISLLPKIFAALKLIQEPQVLSQVLVTIAPHLPAHFVPIAIQMARSVDEPEDRCDILRALAIHHPPLQSEVLELSSYLEDEFTLANVLASLAADGAFGTSEEVLTRVSQIENEAARTLGLSLVAPHLPNAIVPELLQEIQRLQSEHHRIQVLKSIPLAASIIPQVLQMTSGFKDAGSLATALSTLVQVKPTLMPEALQAVQQIEDLRVRANVLGEIAIHQPTLWPTVLDAIRQVPSELSRATVLCHLAPHLPKLYMASALDLVAEISELPVRSQALSGLAMYLPRHLLGRALTHVLEIPDLSVFASIAQQFEPTQVVAHSCIDRVSVLNALASYVPEELLTENVQITEQIGDPKLRAQALSGLLPQLNLKPIDVSKLSERLHCLASRCHQDFLADLLRLGPAIAHLGGPECLSEIAQHLQALESQWVQRSILRPQLK
ncbi:MAG: hypothetical protein AAF329_20055 [Cyanobacteria bacterium P01_A01_bin.17]